MLQASLYDIQWLGHAGSSGWCIYWVFGLWEFKSNEERRMSLKWIGSRIGVLDKSLLSPCIIRNTVSGTGVALVMKFHGEPVEDIHGLLQKK